MSQNILLIDLSSIAHPLFHISASDPDPNATSTKTVERVRALASGTTSGVVVCCDSGRSFRKDVSPDYKANRPESDATLQHQIALAIDVLKADGFPVWSVKGFEADDLIATATRDVLAFGGNGPAPIEHSVTIASADKDLLQLISDRVSIKSLRDGSLIGPAEVKEKFGVAPNQIRDYLSLVGDSSDNVKGANGIGPKKAADLLQRYGNLEDLYSALDATPSAFTNGLIVLLREFQPRIATVRELITLRTDVPLPFDEVFRERVPVDDAVFGGELPDECEPVLAEPRRAAETTTAPAGHTTDRAVQGNDAAPVVRDARPADLQRDRPDVTHSGQGESRSAVVDVLAPAPVEWERQLEPRNISQAKQVAADLFASRLFSAYGNAPAVLATILAGREIGMTTLASLRAFHIIEGKPTLAADVIRALVMRSGKCEYFRCSVRSAEKAEFTTKRKGEPEIALAFTIEEGRTAWPGKRDADGSPDAKSWAASGWGKNPADMLVARASAKLARLVYPDVVHGFYSPEEM